MDMNKRLKALALMLATLAALTGCAGKIRYPSYYTLNVPSAPDPVAPPTVRSSIAVREFQSPAFLRQGPIVYRTTAEKIGFYEFHRWAEDPRVFVTDTIVDRLSASGNFARVSVYSGRSDIDYLFSGKLEKLEEVDYEGGVKVRVAMSAQITKVPTGETIWRNAVSETGNVSERNVSGVVSQMNRTMGVAIDKLLSSLPEPIPGK